MTVLDWIIAGFFGLVAACAFWLTFELTKRIRSQLPTSWKSGKEWLEHSALAGLPSTNFKIVTTVALYFLTFLAWAAAVLFEKPIDEFTFGLWLAFLAGAGGFALAQFNRQRATDYGAMDRQAEIERAKRGIGPATTVAADTANVKGTNVDVTAVAVSADGGSSTPPGDQKS